MRRITHCNKDTIEDIDVHDSTFSGLSYDYRKRQIRIVCSNTHARKKQILQFDNVVLCNIQSCDFWHGGNSILGIANDRKPTEFEKLMLRQQEKQSLYEGSFLDRGILYLSIIIEINSGDTLHISCESIDYYEECTDKLN